MGARCGSARLLTSPAASFAAWRANERHKRSIYERGRHGLAKIGHMSDFDAIFRARMQALARRGGEATRKLVADDPSYYQRIGRLGGEASVAARMRRIYAEIEGRVCEPVTVPPCPPMAQSTPSPTQTKSGPLTLADILGEEAMLSLAFGPASSRSSRR
jgi:general stress protein YciG